MRKYLYLLALLTLFAGAAQAGKITDEQAYLIASKFFKDNSAMRRSPAYGSKATVSLAHAASGYYAFNRGQGGGYVIVAADDMARNMVLGYADSGTFDADSMPGAMRWWLGEYGRELAYAAKAGGTDTRRLRSQLPTYSAIEPLLTSQWGQDDPYNALCPTYQGEQCPTGCVATALAQIMYYHKWPERGTGSASYTWEVNGQAQGTLSADFSQSTYDWAAMTDTYSAASTQEAKDAVAKLMYDLGVATEMGYHPAGSGASSYTAVKAMADHFGYDPGVNMLDRNVYGLAEWQELLYNSIAAGRPVYYSGVTAANEGHAFVLDGYSDGYFHVNWGWDGISNGYFLVSALDPETQGTGGGSSAFNYDQAAAFNMRPAEEGSVATPLMYCTEGFGVKQERATRRDPVTFTGGFFNHGSAPCPMTLGIQVVDADGNATYLRSDYTYTLPMLMGYSEFTMALNDFPQEEGDYTIHPAYYDESEGAWHDMRTNISGGKTHILAKATSTEITFASPQGYADGLLATDLTLLSTAYAGKTFLAKATIANSGNEYFGDVFAAVVAQGGLDIMGNSYQTLIDLTKGSSTEVEFSIAAPQSAGNYELVIATADGTIISNRCAITVEETPAGALSFSITSPLTVADADNVAADNVAATAEITCNSGFYGGTLYLFFFNAAGDESISSLATNLYIGPGETKRVSFTGQMAGAEKGKDYMAAMYYIDDNYLKLVSHGSDNKADFTVGALTPVDGISDEAQPHDISIYNLAGRCLLRQHATKADLSQLAPGTYIIKANGKTRKAVKN